DVGDVDRGLALDDPAGLLHAPRLGVLLHHVDALDHDAVPVRDHAQHLAGLAALAPGDDHDRVVLAETAGAHAQRTSGARETIFMNRFATRYVGTGPKMRVPIGSCALSMSTAELVSKRMYEPS